MLQANRIISVEGTWNTVGTYTNTEQLLWCSPVICDAVNRCSNTQHRRHRIHMDKFVKPISLVRVALCQEGISLESSAHAPSMLCRLAYDLVGRHFLRSQIREVSSYGQLW